MEGLKTGEGLRNLKRKSRDRYQWRATVEEEDKDHDGLSRPGLHDVYECADRPFSKADGNWSEWTCQVQADRGYQKASGYLYGSGYL